MANRRFMVFEYRQVLVRMRAGASDRDVARGGLMGRKAAGRARVVFAAKGWLDPQVALPDDRRVSEAFARRASGAIVESLCEPYRDRITKWAEDGVDATTMHVALVERYGFGGSYASVQRFVKALGLKAPRSTGPLSFTVGEAAQVDFGRGCDLVDRMTGEVIKTWFFVMTLCYSRHMYVEFVLDQKVPTWLGCHRRAFEWFGGIPERLIIDNAKCAILRACRRDPEVQRAYYEHAEAWGFQIDALPPGEPQMKGRVERGVSYVKRSFLPLNEFRSLSDLNQQAADWTLRVGNRDHGTTHQKPLTVFAEIERHLLKPLPDDQPELYEYKRVKVHGDCHVQFENRRYSVPYRLVGQTLWLQATDTSIRVFVDHDLICTHPRLDQPGDISTIVEHMPPNHVAWRMRDQQWCLKQAATVGVCTRAVIERYFDDRVVRNLRAAQGVIAFAKKYGNTRLEAACERAIAYDNTNYRTIRTILENGYDQIPLDDATSPVDGAYDGSGRFCRDMSRLFE